MDNGCMPAQKALLRETEGERLQTMGSLRRRWGIVGGGAFVIRDAAIAALADLFSCAHLQGFIIVKHAKAKLACCERFHCVCIPPPLFFVLVHIFSFF